MESICVNIVSALYLPFIFILFHNHLLAFKQDDVSRFRAFEVCVIVNVAVIPS